MTDGAREAASYDLHVHSTFSDGTEPVAALVLRARREGLAAIAVCDHDSLAQLAAVRHEARELGFPVLAGVEASCWDPATGRKVHVLGLGLEATPDASGPLERIVGETLARRSANTLWQAWRIRRALDEGALGVPEECMPCVNDLFSLDGVVDEAEGSTGLYKQHVMDELCHLPYLDPTYQAVYRAVFKGGGVADRDIPYPDARDVVRAMREQGGHPVLAHPGQMDSWASVADLVAAGLEGIECHHPDHTAAHVRMAREAAREHGLFLTGGSDYHGTHGAPAGPGVCRIGAEEAGEAVAALLEAEGSLR